MSELYTDREREGLDAFFAMASRTPRGEPHVRVVGVGDLAAPAFLARASETAMIAVNVVQAELPRLTATAPEAQARARSAHAPRDTPVPLVSRRLFEIHWGATAASFAWPEAYRLTYFPSYDRFVVTASQDSTEPHGVCDEAIGWFDAGVEPIHASGVIVRRWWSSMVEECDEAHWQGISAAGLVSASDAWAWAGMIWHESPEAAD
jgi:hypothetical protein